MPQAREYNFTEAAQLCIVQGRFEALGLGSSVVRPGHLALGVIKAIARPQFEQLFPGGNGYATLCRALGADGPPAPVSADDVTYSDEAIAAVAGAYRVAGSTEAGTITPLHLLMGILCPHDSDDRPVTPSHAALLLGAAGISTPVLERLLALDPEAG